MQLTEIQQKIIDVVKEKQTISYEQMESVFDIDKEVLLQELSVLTSNGLINSNPKIGYFYTEICNRSFELRNLVNTEVGEVMSMPTIMDEKSSIYSVIVAMLVKDTGSVFLTKNNYLSGVVSRKDLLKTTINKIDISSLPISIVMTKYPNVLYLEPDNTVEDAIRKLVLNDVDSFPVVHKENDKKLKIIGRISKTNIARLIMEVL